MLHLLLSTNILSSYLHFRCYLMDLILTPLSDYLIYLSILSLHFLVSRFTVFLWATRYRSWLRQYAAIRKVAGSIPDEVIGFFQLT
jgi:hypothetical protein